MFRVPKTSTPLATLPVTKRLKEHRGCAYLSYECSQPSLEGYLYCWKHILQDVNAPYKQCGFVFSSNGRKCQTPAAKIDKRDISYCEEHMKKAQLARFKSSSRHSLPGSPEALLLKLSHYVKPTDSSTEDTEDEETRINSLDPFTEISVARVTAGISDILDYASSSDSDVDPLVTTNTIRSSFLDDSDDESMQSPHEDPLKHAGIFTAEEVIYVAREKLIRLQSLYIDQFRRLQYTLKEKRRKYIHALKKEKETLCSIHDQVKETTHENIIYEKLKALNNYHRRSGTEHILYNKSTQRRSHLMERSTQKSPNISKCIFTEGGVKCGERTLPASKHCRKHILKDQHQVLFKACGVVHVDMTCHEPVSVIFDSKCVFHRDLPVSIKLKPITFEQLITPTQTMSSLEVQSMEIDVVDAPQEIDPDDDMAGIMREMHDETHKKPGHNESLNSEASTDTAFSLTAQMSDKDDVDLNLLHTVFKN